MKKYTGLLAVPFLVGSGLANAVIVTEEYTGWQDVYEGQSYTFDFDLWDTNQWPVNDNAPGMTLTTDGVGATGAWQSATLFIDLWSGDPASETAHLDLDAWTLHFWEDDDVLSQTVSFSRPSGGNNFLNASYTLSAAQLNRLDNYGGGSLRVTATHNWFGENDFTITRVGLTVDTGGSSSVNVPEPGTMALLGAGLFGLAAMRRRRTQAA